MTGESSDKRGKLLRDLDSELEALRELERSLEQEVIPEPEVDPGLPDKPGLLRRMLAGGLRGGTEFARGGAVPRAYSGVVKPPTWDPSATLMLHRATTGTYGKKIKRRTLPEDLWRDLKSRLGSRENVSPEVTVILKRFVVRKLWAWGGTSQIFTALDTKLNSRVALKIIPPPASELVRKALPVHLSLEHDRILRIHDVLELSDGTLFLVMPLLEGVTLRQLFFAGEYAMGALLLALRRACEGVAHAHDHGVVHRDLKPGNIQVEPDGGAVVLDWGLACESGRRISGKTQVGTPLYMAPEQFTGGVLTPSTDVFALGTVLFEMITGRHPAGPADDLKQIIHRTCKETAPPPSVLQRGVPESLDDLVVRCLAKDPADRPENALEVLEELEGVR